MPDGDQNQIREGLGNSPKFLFRESARASDSESLKLMSILSFYSPFFIGTLLPGIVISFQFYFSYVLLSRSLNLSISCADWASRAAHNLAAFIQINKQTCFSWTLGHIRPLAPLGHISKRHHHFLYVDMAFPSAWSGMWIWGPLGPACSVNNPPHKETWGLWCHIYLLIPVSSPWITWH